MNRLEWSFGTIFFGWLVLCIGASTALAQVDTGTISGFVRDPSGSGVPDTTVTVKDQSTGLAVEVRTNGEGFFVSPPLRSSDYLVEVHATGFDAQTKRVHIDVAQRIALDFTLLVGAVKQSVEVQDTSSVLQTESATLSNLRS